MSLPASQHCPRSRQSERPRRWRKALGRHPGGRHSMSTAAVQCCSRRPTQQPLRSPCGMSPPGCGRMPDPWFRMKEQLFVGCQSSAETVLKAGSTRVVHGPTFVSFCASFPPWPCGLFGCRHEQVGFCFRYEAEQIAVYSSWFRSEKQVPCHDPHAAQGGGVSSRHQQRPCAFCEGCSRLSTDQL